MSKENFVKFLEEFIGTFFLVSMVGITLTMEPPIGQLAVAGLLTGMIYMGKEISGAHFNPAILFSLYLRGCDFKVINMMSLWLAEILGAVAACFAVYYIKGDFFALEPGPAIDLTKALVCEIFFTFILASVDLNVTTTKKGSEKSYYGIAIGLTILAGSLALGKISGAAFNPAVGSVPVTIKYIFRGGNVLNSFIYLIRPFVGASLAGLTFKFVNPGKKRIEDA